MVEDWVVDGVDNVADEVDENVDGVGDEVVSVGFGWFSPPALLGLKNYFLPLYIYLKL